MRRKKSESVTWKSIKGWVEFGQGLPVAEPKPMEEWKHIQEFLREGKKILASERKRMRGLLKSSCAKFRPLHDPLQAELGTHRWLAHEREESYSDWMKWILEQISDPRRIGKVMGVKEKSLSRFSGEIRIDREVGIKDMEGNRRRTDLDISYGGTDAFRVEIKKGDARDVDPKQLKAQERERQFQYYILIVSAGQTRDCCRPFSVRYWKDICIELRRFVRRMKRMRSKQAVVSAMILGFVGAVEQNLLDMPGNLDDLIDTDQIPLSLGDHIKASF